MALEKEIDAGKAPVTPQRPANSPFRDPNPSFTHLHKPVTSIHQTLHHSHTKLTRDLNENEYEMFMFWRDRFLRPFSFSGPISSTRVVIIGRDPIPVKEK